jgi:hypothetical protein
LRVTVPEALSACGAFRILHPRLYDLAMAIQQHEGFYAPHGSKPPSRAWRNNNPGNLRKSPMALSEEEGYAVFKTYHEGLLALLLDLEAKATGHTGTGLGPASTMRQLIAVWAPPSDNNDTDAYVRAVALAVGLTPEATLSALFWS